MRNEGNSKSRMTPIVDSVMEGHIEMVLIIKIGYLVEDVEIFNTLVCEALRNLLFTREREREIDRERERKIERDIER